VTPRLVVLSAPSGGGKTTIAKAVRDRHSDQFGFSVSATTRKPRAGEREGVDYYFWAPDKFLKGVAEGKFLEHAEYAGELYGTLKTDVERILKSGRHVLLDIEVDGAAQVRLLRVNHAANPGQLVLPIPTTDSLMNVVADQSHGCR